MPMNKFKSFKFKVTEQTERLFAFFAGFMFEDRLNGRLNTYDYSSIEERKWSVLKTTDRLRIENVTGSQHDFAKDPSLID